MTDAAGALFPPVAGRKAGFDRSAYLFSPLIDFLCLGGGSAVLFVLLMAFAPKTPAAPWMMTLALWIAYLVNHPHFAHSYQIFYRDFRAKLRSEAYPESLRWRYLFSGVIVPALLASFLITSLATGAFRTLGLGVSLMFFLVGWHYVKQGYGMAMVDAVLKKRFFNDAEKQALMLNAYATWGFEWALTNRIVKTHKYFGLDYAAFTIPDPLFYALGAVAALTTLHLAGRFAVGVLRDGRRYPLNGLLAYAVSLYAWLLVGRVNPIYIVFIPALHSLQYMIVVWRFELNRLGAARAAAEAADADEARGPWRKLFVFYAFAFVLGYVGFYGAPKVLAAAMPGVEAAAGARVFIVACWVFINVHHYFIDNVMWRRGNPDVARHLFGARPKPA